MSGVSGSSKYITPSQTPTHATGMGSWNGRPLLVTSSDDRVSLDLSSDNSLTILPTQAKRLLTPICGPVLLCLGRVGPYRYRYRLRLLGQEGRIL